MFFSFTKTIFCKRKNYLFNSFITGKIDLNIFNNFNSNFNSETYNINDDKYNEYYSINGSELKLLFSLNLGVKSEIFEKYCNNYEIIILLIIQSNIRIKNEINIIFSSSCSNLFNNNNINTDDNNYNNNNNNNKITTTTITTTTITTTKITTTTITTTTITTTTIIIIINVIIYFVSKNTFKICYFQINQK